MLPFLFIYLTFYVEGFTMSKLLIDEPALQVLPSLAIAIGLEEAIFVQQIHYWLLKSPHVKKGRRWIYNTYAQWLLQFPFWSTDQLKRIISSVKKQEVMFVEKLSDKALDHTNWFSINYEKLKQLEVIHTPSVNAPIDQCEIAGSEKSATSQQNQRFEEISDRCEIARSIGAKSPEQYKEHRLPNRDSENNNSDVVVKKTPQPTHPVDKSPKIDGLTHLANKAGIPMFAINQHLQKHSVDILVDKLTLLIATRGVTNPIGWLISALEKNYQKSESSATDEPRRVVPDVNETLDYLNQMYLRPQGGDKSPKGLKSLKQALKGFNDAAS